MTAALTHPVPAAGLPSQCPVNHGKSREPPPPPPAAGLPSQCPVNHGSGTGAAASASQPRAARGTIYNVYAQPIDPTNQMPSTANQQPAPGQTKPLSVTRVQSTIPKGGTESTWQYPSPQMFWNSLVRKGKTDDATEVRPCTAHTLWIGPYWQTTVVADRAFNNLSRSILENHNMPVCHR